MPHNDCSILWVICLAFDLKGQSIHSDLDSATSNKCFLFLETRGSFQLETSHRSDKLLIIIIKLLRIGSLLREISGSGGNLRRTFALSAGARKLVKRKLTQTEGVTYHTLCARFLTKFPPCQQELNITPGSNRCFGRWESRLGTQPLATSTIVEHSSTCFAADICQEPNTVHSCSIFDQLVYILTDILAGYENFRQLYSFSSLYLLRIWKARVETLLSIQIFFFASIYFTRMAR